MKSSRWCRRLFQVAYQALSGRDHPAVARFSDGEDLFRCFELIDCGVPPLEERTRDHQPFMEWYCLRGYLLPLGRHDLLAYPLTVQKGESPDFLLIGPDGVRIGLEITQSTRDGLLPRLKREPGVAWLGRGPDGRAGWAGDEAEQDWCDAVSSAVEKKLRVIGAPHWHPAERQELVIYDNTFIPGLDWARARAFLQARLPALLARSPTPVKPLGLSLLTDTLLVHDLAGAWRELPFDPEWA
jgi:hypothetical protein